MKKRILLIEDDKFLVKIYSNKLTLSGFDVEIAINADEGLRKVMNRRPDAILLDLILPGKDGFEFLSDLSKIKENTPRIPVVILSNLGQDIDRERTKELGASDYLIKSNVSLEDIVTTAKRLTGIA